MERKKGWHITDFDFEDIKNVGLSVEFEYCGKTYWLCTDQSPTETYVYTLPEYQKIATYYDGNEGFQKAELFGKPLKEIFNDSFIGWIS
ncbi:MAG: hypothetical protein IJI45_18260 [Anaerolineaceae bacterium]|nr:hypothetical protein [Anaerolineaceae bacterium]